MAIKLVVHVCALKFYLGITLCCILVLYFTLFAVSWSEGLQGQGSNI